jgi:hypothetical protein
MAHRLRATQAGAADGDTNAGRDDRIALVALAGVTLMVGGVETAFANVTQTETFTIGPTSASSGQDVLTFNMFDPSLGTLAGVTIVLTSATITGVTVDVPDSASGSRARAYICSTRMARRLRPAPPPLTRA